MYNNNFYPNYGSQLTGYNQQPNNGLVWVQGEAGAKSYMVAPGNTVLLLDSERPTFYVKTTDPNGIPQPLKIYDFTERAASGEHAQTPEVDMSQYCTKDEVKQYIADVIAASTSTKKKGSAKSE